MSALDRITENKFTSLKPPPPKKTQKTHHQTTELIKQENFLNNKNHKLKTKINQKRIKETLHKTKLIKELVFF